MRRCPCSHSHHFHLACIIRGKLFPTRFALASSMKSSTPTFAIVARGCLLDELPHTDTDQSCTFCEHVHQLDPFSWCFHLAIASFTRTCCLSSSDSQHVSNAHWLYVSIHLLFTAPARRLPTRLPSQLETMMCCHLHPSRTETVRPNEE